MGYSLVTAPLGSITVPRDTYVAMLHEWLWYLAEPALPKRNLAVGEAIIELANANATAELTLPDSRTVELSPGSAQFRHPSTRLPGEYVLRMKGKEGDASTTRFLVQRNAEESDLKALSEQDMKQLSATEGFLIGAASDALAVSGNIEIPKHPLEGWLLGLLAFALLGEMLLAGWTTHRRNLRLTPATMGG